jgi:hypothetical protein
VPSYTASLRSRLSSVSVGVAVAGFGSAARALGLDADWSWLSRRSARLGFKAKPSREKRHAIQHTLNLYRFGKRLMAGALDQAWRLAPGRIWLHTSSFDHHSVIGFYRACGFEPYAAGFEITDDPRIKGTLPREAAPQIPLIETEWVPVAR